MSDLTDTLTCIVSMTMVMTSFSYLQIEKMNNNILSKKVMHNFDKFYPMCVYVNYV